MSVTLWELFFQFWNYGVPTFVAEADSLIMEYATKLVHSKGLANTCYITDKK